MTDSRDDTPMVKAKPLKDAAARGARPGKPQWLSLLHELVRCYQDFEERSNAHIRALEMTPSQFDVVATLGNTDGMTCKELGERTLITKGTLTGVLDRMEAKGLIVRQPSKSDRRSFLVCLTAEGEACFERVFYTHLDHMGPYFETLSATEREQITRSLSRLRKALSQP